MNNNSNLWVRLAIMAATGVSVAAAAPPALAQSALAMGAAGSVAHSSDDLLRRSKSLARGGYAVVVDLDANELSFRQGREILWTAPIGTGTGLRLETDDQEWDFSTPNGVFHVQFKEEDPTWIAPDWYFIENDLPIPPRNDPRRRFPGGLGAAAVYIGHDLAIHGTDKPELLGQRVSHGCIRLSDADAQRLYHNVQIGTEVLIVGGEDVVVVEEDAGNDPSTFSPEAKQPKPKDAMLERWKNMSTSDLGGALAGELWMPEETTRWTDITSLLLTRAISDDDDAALTAVLAGVADLPSGKVEREYRTYLADAFGRAPMRTLSALSDLDRSERDLAAGAIVAAMAGLYSGDLEAPSAPWPTSRIPRGSVQSDGRLGWNALARAERGHRSDRDTRTSLQR